MYEYVSLVFTSDAVLSTLMEANNLFGLIGTWKYNYSSCDPYQQWFTAY